MNPLPRTWQDALKHDTFEHLLYETIDSLFFLPSVEVVIEGSDEVDSYSPRIPAGTIVVVGLSVFERMLNSCSTFAQELVGGRAVDGYLGCFRGIHVFTDANSPDHERDPRLLGTYFLSSIGQYEIPSAD